MKAPAKVIPVFIFAVVCSAFVSGENLAYTGETRLPAEKSPSSYHKLTGNEPRTFVYETLHGISSHVTTEGLSSIRIGQREPASGGWSVFNAENWFRDSSSGIVKTEPVANKSLEVLAANRVRVRHAAGDLVCVADYTFYGEDVTISSRIENKHSSEPINVVGFSGLVFHFDHPPEGLMQVQHISYFQAHGLELCHPSFRSKIGGSYAIDDSIGVGVSPWKIGWTRSLILWDYSSWASEKREKSPDRRLIYFVGTTLSAKGKNGPEYRVWSGMNNWEIYQWLVPGSQLVARLYQTEGDIPPNLEAVDRFYYRNRITPLVPVSDFRRLEKVEQIQPEFISDEGKWN